jgi:hypothetical protein
MPMHFLYMGHMMIHGSCAMIFIVHKKFFLLQGRFFSYHLLLDTMTHNASIHLLKLKAI